jgi:CRISPR-associated protein Cmr4
MAMNSIIVSMLAETFIHPGSGQNVGAIDLPVAREAATDYPYIAGSSLKGALRDAYEQHLRATLPDTDTPAEADDSNDGSNTDAPSENDEATEKKSAKDKEVDKHANSVFGEQAQAGNLVVSDARLLLLPVRSLSGAYKWVTCGHLLERFLRDLERSGMKQSHTLPAPAPQQVITTGSGKLFLEELSFDIQDGQSEALKGVVTLLQQYLPSSVSSRLERQLAILHNDDFAWFARYGLAVNARNQLTDKKTSNNLWYEETIPPDTLMYTVLAERRGAPLRDLANIGHYLQVGGNETVGQGWFRLQGLEAHVEANNA